MTEPITVIQNWQKSYKSVSQDSETNLCNSPRTTDILPDWKCHYNALIQNTDDSNMSTEPDQKLLLFQAKEHFMETITEFLSELGHEQLYKCFLDAATEIYNDSKKDLDRIEQFTNCIKHGQRTAPPASAA